MQLEVFLEGREVTTVAVVVVVVAVDIPTRKRGPIRAWEKPTLMTVLDNTT